MRAPKNNTCGFTTLELLVAITVMAVMVALIFQSYLVAYKGFLSQGKRAAGVSELVLLKTRLDKSFSGMDSVLEITQNSISYKRTGEDGIKHVFSCMRGELSSDGKIVARGVVKFDCQFSDKATREGKKLLIWGVDFEKNRWIGGAGMVFTRR